MCRIYLSVSPERNRAVPFVARTIFYLSAFYRSSMDEKDNSHNFVLGYGQANYSCHHNHRSYSSFWENL